MVSACDMQSEKHPLWTAWPKGLTICKMFHCHDKKHAFSILFTLELWGRPPVLCSTWKCQKINLVLEEGLRVCGMHIWYFKNIVPRNFKWRLFIINSLSTIWMHSVYFHSHPPFLLPSDPNCHKESAGASTCWRATQCHWFCYCYDEWDSSTWSPDGH